jgi:hypothetical protein
MGFPYIQNLDFGSVSGKNRIQIGKRDVGNRGDSSFGEFQQLGKGGFADGKNRAESSRNIF